MFLNHRNVANLRLSNMLLNNKACPCGRVGKTPRVVHWQDTSATSGLQLLCVQSTWQFFVTFLGRLSDPFKGLSDLQLGEQKVTLNHLRITFFFPRIMFSERQGFVRNYDCYWMECMRSGYHRTLVWYYHVHNWSLHVLLELVGVDEPNQISSYAAMQL